MVMIITIIGMCLLAKKSGQEAAKYVISKCPGIFPLREPNPVSSLSRHVSSNFI